MSDDLISRGKLKKHYAWWRETENGRKMADLFDEIVDAQPTAEVPDRKVGKWTEREVIEDRKAIEEWQSARCSVCGKYHTTPYLYYFDNFAYCPNCGAKMEATP